MLGGYATNAFNELLDVGGAIVGLRDARRRFAVYPELKSLRFQFGCQGLIPNSHIFVCAIGRQSQCGGVTCPPALFSDAIPASSSAGENSIASCSIDSWAIRRFRAAANLVDWNMRQSTVGGENVLRQLQRTRLQVFDMRKGFTHVEAMVMALTMTFGKRAYQSNAKAPCETELGITTDISPSRIEIQWASG